MMQHHDVLDQVGQLELPLLAGLPIEDLDFLINQVAKAKDSVRRCEALMQSELNDRFGARAQQLRQQAGKDTGTVRFDDEGYEVVADLPKRPEYDQAKLKTAVETLRNWGENPEHYVAFEIKVSEAKYNAWPPAIRTLFEPARTLNVGKPLYKLAKVKPNTRLANLSRTEAM